ncbi:LCP family protein [Arthrobacter sp. UYCu712]|uniref:LCP family protein n=1 Tax=Arthrobacter sp. UYCu712 TaxID=3156340 RepID=UPI00339150FC
MPNRFEADRETAPGRGSRQAVVPPDADGRPSAQQGSDAGPARQKRRKRPLVLVLMILVLLVPASVGAYLFSLAAVYDSGTRTIEDAFPPEAVRVPAAQVPAGAAKPLNILVMGSDSREAPEDSGAKASAGTASNQRADTLMLLHIPADRANVYSISLMRDLWVDLPGHGEAKINAALAFGGVPLMVQTVESLLQQRVDHVVSIDFAGFKGLTDALGGVKVDVKVPFTSDTGGKRYIFSRGPNALDGTEALAFVRERYAFPDGDYQRVKNQQAYLRAVIARTFDAGKLTNPVTLHNVVSAVSPFLSVGQGLDSLEVGRLAFSLRDIRANDAVFFTLPTAGVGTSADGQSIVLPDVDAIADITAAVTADTLGDYVATTNLGNGN